MPTDTPETQGRSGSLPEPERASGFALDVEEMSIGGASVLVRKAAER